MAEQLWEIESFYYKWTQPDTECNSYNAQIANWHNIAAYIARNYNTKNKHIPTYELGNYFMHPKLREIHTQYKLNKITQYTGAYRAYS